MKNKDLFFDPRSVKKEGKFLGPCSLIQPQVVRNHCLVMLLYEGELARVVDVTNEKMYERCFLKYLEHSDTIRIKVYSLQEERLERLQKPLRVWIGDYDAK